MRWWRDYEQECRDWDAWQWLAVLDVFPERTWQQLTSISGIETFIYPNSHVIQYLGELHPKWEYLVFRVRLA